jgi:hypothetical protein
MLAILRSLGMFIVDLFKSRCRLEAENLFLRHQLSIALRRTPLRVRLRGSDRALLVWMTRLWPSLLGAAQVVQPETILRWHRAGFEAFWRWKCRKRAGRPKIDRGLRDLIRRMSKENPVWGASRIHGELLMLGFEVAQSTVSKYMMRGGAPPSQSWKTFLRNHAQAIAAIDLCVVPTLTFERLFAFLVLGHGRRQLLWFEVTRHPTAEWLARQITEAFPWTSAPAYLVRDNDRAYGDVFKSRVTYKWLIRTVQFVATKWQRRGHPVTPEACAIRWLSVSLPTVSPPYARRRLVIGSFADPLQRGLAMMRPARSSSCQRVWIRITHPPGASRVRRSDLYQSQILSRTCWESASSRERVGSSINAPWARKPIMAVPKISCPWRFSAAGRRACR